MSDEYVLLPLSQLLPTAAATAAGRLQGVGRLPLPSANLQPATCSNTRRPIVYVDKHYTSAYKETIIYLHKHKSDYNLN